MGNKLPQEDSDGSNKKEEQRRSKIVIVPKVRKAKVRLGVASGSLGCRNLHSCQSGNSLALAPPPPPPRNRFLVVFLGCFVLGCWIRDLVFSIFHSSCP